MEKISEHISYEEAVNSPTAVKHAIDNTPTESILINMRAVSINCFEPLRKWYNKPITIDSFYRCLSLNTILNGAINSQHMHGEAIDISAGSKEENKKLFEWCKANLIFDQLIWENGGEWIHISFKVGMNRNQTIC